MPHATAGRAGRYIPGGARSRQGRGELIVRAAFARFDIVALAIAMGCVCAFSLWAASVILLVKGAPPGVNVGPHLALLTNFLPGFSVSWFGSFVGLLYGFLIGVVLGGLIAFVWNVVHHIYLVLFVTRRHFAGDL
jgi:hypothetical protein